jgi:hypothetical protein
MVQVATEAPTGVVASPEAERVGGVSVQLMLVLSGAVPSSGGWRCVWWCADSAEV